MFRFLLPVANLRILASWPVACLLYISVSIPLCAESSELSTAELQLLEDEATGSYSREHFLEGARVIETDDELSAATDEAILYFPPGFCAGAETLPHIGNPPGGLDFFPLTRGRTRSPIVVSAHNIGSVRAGVAGRTAALFYFSIRNGYDRRTQERFS